MEEKVSIPIKISHFTRAEQNRNSNQREKPFKSTILLSQLPKCTCHPVQIVKNENVRKTYIMILLTMKIIIC